MLEDASNLGKVTRLPDRSEHVARDGCPCSPCRRARRRASEVGLAPLEKLDLVPEWKRLLAAVGAAVFVLGCCWAFGYVLLRVLGI